MPCACILPRPLYNSNMACCGGTVIYIHVLLKDAAGRILVDKVQRGPRNTWFAQALPSLPDGEYSCILTRRRQRDRYAITVLGGAFEWTQLRG